MTPEQVAHLIADGESFTVEFKDEQRAPLSDANLVDAVVCLVNGEGGVLLVGVEDDSRGTGARPRHELAAKMRSDATCPHTKWLSRYRPGRE